MSELREQGCTVHRCGGKWKLWMSLKSKVVKEVCVKENHETKYEIGRYEYWQRFKESKKLTIEVTLHCTGDNDQCS